MSTKLTKSKVRSLKAPADQYLEVWDSDFKVMGSSFGIRVSGVTGSKSWVLIYRKDGSGGKRMTIGSYPAMSVADAREKATKIASGIVLGADPVAEKKSRADAPTFKELAEKFIVQWPKLRDLRPSTAKEYERIIRKELLPRWGERKAADITRRDVIGLLDEIRIEREAAFMANRVRALVKTLYGWAVTRDLVPASPAAVLPKRPKERSRERVLSDAEVKTLWTALDDEAEPIASLYRFLIATGQRVTETRLMKWKDIEDGTWTIPEQHTKARREHRVPLSPLAQSILDDLEPVTGEAKHVFETPSSRSKGPIRWVAKATERIRDRCGFTFRAHDLRRTMATGMRRLGVDRLVVERCQNRTDGSVASVYDRYAMEPEVREAFTLWGAHLEKILADDEAAKDGKAVVA